MRPIVVGRLSWSMIWRPSSWGSKEFEVRKDEYLKIVGCRRRIWLTRLDYESSSVDHWFAGWKWRVLSLRCPICLDSSRVRLYFRAGCGAARYNGAGKEERERRLFVSNVSHELRTPLTSVKSYLEALDEGALSEPVAPDFIKVSLDETNRMMRMVSDLLSLSRIDNATSHFGYWADEFLTAFITFILNRFDKIRSQNDDKKYEIIRRLPH